MHIFVNIVQNTSCNIQMLDLNLNLRNWECSCWGVVAGVSLLGVVARCRLGYGCLGLVDRSGCWEWLVGVIAACGC